MARFGQDGRDSGRTNVMWHFLWKYLFIPHRIVIIKTKGTEMAPPKCGLASQDFIGVTCRTLSNWKAHPSKVTAQRQCIPGAPCWNYRQFSLWMSLLPPELSLLTSLCERGLRKPVNFNIFLGLGSLNLFPSLGMFRFTVNGYATISGSQFCSSHHL